MAGMAPTQSQEGPHRQARHHNGFGAPTTRRAIFPKFIAAGMPPVALHPSYQAKWANALFASAILCVSSFFLNAVPRF